MTNKILYDIEHKMYQHRPAFELKMIQKALSMHKWLNTPADTARLSAVTDLLKGGAV